VHQKCNALKNGMWQHGFGSKAGLKPPVNMFKSGSKDMAETFSIGIISKDQKLSM